MRNLVTIIVILVIVGCSDEPKVERETKFQCASPTTNIAAVSIEEMRHAFGPADYYQKVELISANSDSNELILEMDHGYEAHLEWINDSKLVITIPNSANLIFSKNTSEVYSELDISVEKAESEKGRFKSLSAGCS